jgi:quercetin dioxygenase-like cupin family protein
MTSDPTDDLDFDPLVGLALAELAAGEAPRREVRQRVMDAVRDQPPVPAGFVFRFAAAGGWVPHPVPGIRMRVLALNRTAGYATLLLDVAPGTRFPAHHHTGDEECYVISGTVYSYGRRMGPGDFLHADGDTDHGELWTDEGAMVLLVVPPEDYMPEPPG